MWYTRTCGLGICSGLVISEGLQSPSYRGFSTTTAGDATVTCRDCNVDSVRSMYIPGSLYPLPACGGINLVTLLLACLCLQYKPPSLKKKTASADPSGRSAPHGSSLVMKQSNFGHTYKVNGQVEDGPDSSVGAGMHARSGSVRGSVVVVHPPGTKKPPPTGTTAVRKTAFSSGVTTKGGSGGGGDRPKGGNTTFSQQQSQRLHEMVVESRIDSDSLESLSRVSLQNNTTVQIQPQRNVAQKRTVVRSVCTQPLQYVRTYVHLCRCASVESVGTIRHSFH